MGELSESSASLRIFGDDLIPDEITALLGSEPTASDKKGPPEAYSLSEGASHFIKIWKLAASLQTKASGQLRQPNKRNFTKTH